MSGLQYVLGINTHQDSFSCVPITKSQYLTAGVSLTFSAGVQLQAKLFELNFFIC